MNEIEKYIDNQFFIIDSNNLNSVKSKLFGFAIYNENILGDDGDGGQAGVLCTRRHFTA